VNFKELKIEIKGIKFDTLRADSDNYFEAVIAKDAIEQLIRTLEIFFEAPLWPSEKKLNVQIEEMINDFGGIEKGQTLYFKNDQENVIFAMLWPWRDGERTTLKLVNKEK
jgi:hypothetical protein